MDRYHLLKAAHILSAVVWIGGMFFAYAVLRPSIAALEPAQRLVLHREVFRRFFRVVWVAMLTQLATGFWMVFAFYGGMADLEPAINIMMTLGLTMALIFLVIFFGPWRAFRLSPSPAPVGKIRWLVLANLVLGVVTILVAMLG